MGATAKPPPRRSQAVGEFMITTPEGTLRAEWGDWIIRGIAGELYSCKPDIVAATYEAVGDETEGGEGQCGTTNNAKRIWPR